MKVAGNDLGHRQRPQGKLEIKLQRVLGADDAGELGHLLGDLATHT